ncbi:MAG: hypothetical protein N3H31_05030 [Candidatus Nezhaarchaeota archaeon]|nr:hypothetical protein [Candidatus Nezhaarchaeota archaeon]
MKLSPLISNCQCNISNCREEGGVCWEEDGHRYVHVRVDGCVESLKALKKVDCLILCSRGGAVYAFLIEVKARNYDIDEVKEKMEGTLSVLNDILDCPDRKLIVVPIVYAESHRISWRRYAFLTRLKYRGMNVLTAFLRYCEPIQKAVTLALDKRY